MAETNETCIGNMITKSAWLCQRRGGGVALVETSAQDKVDTGMFKCTLAALHYYTLKGLARSADGECNAKTGCHSQVMATLTSTKWSLMNDDVKQPRCA